MKSSVTSFWKTSKKLISLCAFSTVILLTSCEKNEPGCTNCPPELIEPGINPDTVITPIDPRAKFAGKFRMSLRLMEKKYKDGIYMPTDTTYYFDSAVSFIPGDSIGLCCYGTPQYKKFPKILISGAGHLSNLGLVDSTGRLKCVEPYSNSGGFINPDSIHFIEEFNHRAGHQYTLIGSRIK